MESKQKNVFGAIVLIAIITFILFLYPNAVGSADQNMLAIFEPDEYAQYPHVIRMLKGGEAIREAVRRFIAYQHYYYGFPFYSLSAIVIFPVKLISGGLDNTGIIMLLLRQLVSVLPMLLAIAIFVYLQTRFKSYLTSLSLFLFLLLIPAVVKNNLWWHPDSLTILFIALTFFFLDRDDLRLGSNFYFAALSCGLATGTKLIGLFFFLTIPTYLIWGTYKKEFTFKKTILSATFFVLIMIAVIFLSNPISLTSSGREAIFKIQSKQSEAMSFGWGVEYTKGPASWFGIIQEYYGYWFFILLTIGVVVIGVFRGSKRLLNLLILTWVLPYSLYILYFIAIKPKHFFLPVALPLFSGLVILPSLIQGRLPRKDSKPLSKGAWFVGILALLIVGVQFIHNLTWSIDHYQEAVNREADNASIAFFNAFNQQYLSKIPETDILRLYHDVRVYAPISDRWEIQTKWGLVDMDFITEENFSVLLISKQRVMDYTQPSALETAADPIQMKRTSEFYSAAASNELPGYVLLFQDDFGIALVREDIYELYYR